MDRLRSPVEAAEASGDVAGDSVEVTVVDLPVVGVPAPLYVVTEDLPVAAGWLALAVVRASAGGVAAFVAVASPACSVATPVVAVVVEEFPAVPPLLVVLLRDPLAPAPLAVADAAPPTPVAWAVAALSSVPLEVASGCL